MEDYAESKKLYYSIIRRKKLIIVALLAASLFCCFVTIGLSHYTDLDWIGSIKTMIMHIQGNPSTEGNDDFAIWERMIPRAILAFFAGLGLAVGGCIMQTIMRNPLADPYTTGISSGAGLGAAIAIILGFSIPGMNSFSSVVVFAFLFSLIPAALIITISQFRKTTPAQMILIGVAVMYFFGATNTVIMLMADPGSLKETYMWTMGNLGNGTWDNVPLVAAATTIGCIVLYTFSRVLNVANMGDNGAASLGVSPLAVRRICLVIISMMVAVIVSFSGTIGFVGIIAPHLARMLVGSDNKYLIPAAGAVGAMLIILADTIAKMVIMPVGVITSVIGAPLFLLILIKMRKGTIF